MIAKSAKYSIDKISGCKATNGEKQGERSKQATREEIFVEEQHQLQAANEKRMTKQRVI